jgi:hypothetical protein
MAEAQFRIELWPADRAEQVLGRANDDKHAHAVYSAMVEKFPGETIVLWDRARVIARND